MGSNLAINGGEKMKIKEVNIKIEPEKEFDKRITRKLKEIDKGKYPKKLKTNISFESIEDLRKVLTKKRLQLFIKHFLQIFSMHNNILF